eukprot:TRINITY_DN20444_c0_g1_i2.p1 TRINITY_DN20444_c0_g1~~TRINITY_DN20444_c0_g1_i2.p1  ORF type:complete len:671 (-),score=148.62 TRINITY_DN20444_c0_g1_i2:158-2146(-)
MADLEGREASGCSQPPRAGTLRRYDSHFHKRHIVLEVQDACYSVRTSHGRKQILDRISLIAEAGESMALMGPSGAGKTTFLDFMSMGLKGGKATGRVTLNGRPLTFEMFRQHAVYVEQYDTHWAFLTCQETMRYAAALYVPGNRVEQRERVEQIMLKLGLNECKDAYAGNKFFKGMSGGQKKRLTLGMALLKAPVLMLLDEPTSGLDAASTASVMQALKDMCRECNLIAVATIHQPSTEVFMGFRNVMFMANGRTAYCGGTADVAAYCASIGKPLPPETNPADFFLEITNSEFAGRAAVDSIVQSWGNRHVKPPSGVAEPLPRGIRPQSRRQLGTIFSRQSLLSVRDPTLYVGRMGMFIVCNVFFAVIYWKARQKEQQYVNPHFFLIGWFIAIPTLLSVIVVFAQNEEFHLVKKEIKNGLLKTGAYLVASTLLTIPYMLVLSLCSLGLPAVVAGWQLSVLPSQIGIFALTLWCFEQMGKFMGVSFPNPMIGALAMMGLWFASFLFMGSFLQEEFIIDPLQILMKVLPLKWTHSSIAYSEFIGTTWPDAELSSESPVGFVCPGIPDMVCSGHTGEQVLRTLSLSFSDATPHDPRWESVIHLVCIGFAFKILMIVVVLYKSRVTSPIKYEGLDADLEAEDDVSSSGSDSDMSPTDGYRPVPTSS